MKSTFFVAKKFKSRESPSALSAFHHSRAGLLPVYFPVIFYSDFLKTGELPALFVS